jgi:hypothetical protein
MVGRSQEIVRRIFAALAVALVAACSTAAPSVASEGGTKEGDPNGERAGTNCFSCHSQFKLAGTVRDPSIEYIEIRDINGVETRLYPNQHRNFFRHHQLVPPFEVVMVAVDGRRRVMHDAPHGSCNACHHNLPGGAGAL